MIIFIRSFIKYLILEKKCGFTELIIEVRFFSASLMVFEFILNKFVFT